MKTCTRGSHGMVILAQARSGLIPNAPKTPHAAGSCRGHLRGRDGTGWIEAAQNVTGRSFGSALVYSLVFATAISQGTVVRAQTQQDPLNARTTTKVISETQNAAEAASQWGLTDAEWQRYRQVMAQKRGVWSPGLDPLTALGVSAATASERKHFAELYVRAEFERVRKELAFQIEVDQAWKRLYPDTPRLLDVAQSSTDTRPVQRYAVVVSADCTTCEQVIKDRLRWLAKTKSRESVDVHVVGTGGDDANLRAWVKENPWLEEALKSRAATLNHGDQFAGLTHFPVVYAKKEGGQWAREL
jgi:integrating conjugative element protein (TIGR03759 family)